jgi:DNA-binding NarL/FixJ family response regulator
LKVGIQLALGKTKRAIADKLGRKLTSVADLARKLYQTLEVHNPAKLGTSLAGRRPRVNCLY